MDQIEAVMHELGSAFAAGLAQPGSMQAVLTDRCLSSQIYGAAGNRSARPHSDLYALMARLRSLEGIHGVFVVELTAIRSGGYVVTSSGDLPSLPPRVVLDDGYRYPNHPRPGMRKPWAAVNDGRPTDPAVLAEVQALVAEFVERHTHLRGEPPRFPLATAKPRSSRPRNG